MFVGSSAGVSVNESLQSLVWRQLYHGGELAYFGMRGVWTVTTSGAEATRDAAGDVLLSFPVEDAPPADTPDDVTPADEPSPIGTHNAEDQTSRPQTDLGGNATRFLSTSSQRQVSDLGIQQLSTLAQQSLVEHWANGGRAISAADRRSIADELAELTTAPRVTTELPVMATVTGAKFVLGEGDSAVLVTLRSVLTRLAGRPAVPAAAPAPARRQGEQAAAHSSVVDASHRAQTMRELPLSTRIVLGLGNLPILKNLIPTGSLRLTFNEFRHSVSVDLGASHSHILRDREPHFAHDFDGTWHVTIAPAWGADDLNTIQGDDSNPHQVTVWFPEHLARPTSAPLTKAAALGPVDHIVLDTVHDPGGLYGELRRGFAELDDLDADSQRRLLALASSSNLRGGFPRLQRDGLLSEPLYDRAGNPVGIMKLTATVNPTHQVSSTASHVELYHRGRIGTSGTGLLRNVREIGGGLGATLVGSAKKLADLVSYGTFTQGGPSFQARLGTTTSHGHNAGARGLVMRGKSTVGRVAVVDADIDWVATLLHRGLETQHPWTGRAADRQGGRLRVAPVALTNPSTDRHPPAGIEYGRDPGLADITDFTPTAIPKPKPNPAHASTVDNTVDNQVIAQLQAEGFLPSANSANQLQLDNERRVLDAISGDYRQVHFDDLEGIGIWIPLARPTVAGGLEWVSVRWYTERAEGSSPVHGGQTTDTRLLYGMEHEADLDASLADGGHAEGRIQGDLSVPVADDHVDAHGQPVLRMMRAVPLTFGPYRYTREQGRTASLGSRYGREVLLETTWGNPVHVFDIAVRLKASMYRANSNEPFWRYERTDPDAATVDYQDATARVWVTEDRVTNAQAPRLAVPYERDISQIDRDALARGTPVPAPLLTAATTVRGSVELNAMFRGMTERVFSRPNSFSAVLSGAGVDTDGSLSGQARRNFVSSTRLRSALSQAMRGTYASDQLFESGALSQSEGWLELQAYAHDAPRFDRATTLYAEDTTMASEGGGLTTSHTRSHAAEGAVAGSAAPNSDTSFSGGLNPKWSRDRSQSDTDSTGATEVRTAVNNGEVFIVHVPLTYVGTVRGGHRNLLGNIRTFFGDNNRFEERALVIDDAVEARLTFAELQQLWMSRGPTPAAAGVGPRIIGLPGPLEAALTQAEEQFHQDEAARRAGETPYGAGIHYLPRRIFARLGLGDDATVSDVAPIGARATAPAGLGGGQLAALRPAAPAARALYVKGLAALEAAIPGITHPGSNTYLPGAHQLVADLASPNVVRGGVGRFFSAGPRDEAATLVSVPITTTQHGGAVQGEIRLVGRPQPVVSAIDHFRQIFAREPAPRPNVSPGLETHATASTGKEHGHGRSRFVWVALAGSVSTPGGRDSIRSHAPGGSIGVGRGTGSSTARSARTDHRDTVRAGGTIDFDIPMELAIVVSTVPMESSPLNAIGPVAVRTLTGQNRRTPAIRPDDWVAVQTTLRLQLGDTTDRPAIAAPPNWLAPADSDAARPANPVYQAMPPAYRASWFNGHDALLEAAQAVLLDTTASIVEGAELHRYLAGTTAIAGLPLMLDPGGVSRTFLTQSWDSVFDYQETLAIHPIEGSAWHRSDDALAGQAQPVDVGAGSIPFVESATAGWSGSSFSVSTEQRANVTATLGPTPWLKKDLVDKKYGSAPGNADAQTVTIANLSSTGGEPSSVSASASASSRSAVRLPSGPAPGTPAPGAVPVAPQNVLAYRTVTLAVTGTRAYRSKLRSTWTSRPTVTRYVTAIVEARIPADLVQPTPVALPGPLSQPLVPPQPLGPPPGPAGPLIAWSPGGSGDRELAGPSSQAVRDSVAAARAAVQRRPGGFSRRRLAGWINEVQVGAGQVGEVLAADCVQRAWGAFIAVHGRSTNRGVGDEALVPDLAGLVDRLGGVLTSVSDVGGLVGRLAANPGWMLLVHARGWGSERAHVFWLVADGSSGEGVLRWVDTQQHAAFDRPAEPLGGQADRWGQQLARSDTQVLLLDGAGRPVSIDGQSRDQTVAALLDPSDTREPGALRRGPAQRGLRSALGPALETWNQHVQPHGRFIGPQLDALEQRFGTERFGEISRAVARRPLLVGLFLQRPEVMEKVLRTLPNIFGHLAWESAVSDEVLVAVPGFADLLDYFVDRQPDVLEVLEQESGYRAVYLNLFALKAMRVLGDRAKLLLEVPAPVGIGFLLVYSPLGGVIAEHPNANVVYRELAETPGLVEQLRTAVAGEFLAGPAWTREQYQALLDHDELFDVLRGNPVAARAVAHVAGMLEAVMGDPGIAAVLSDRWELVDALIGSPALSARLAGSPALLGVAAGNHEAVAAVLSVDPARFDELADENRLTESLAAARAPEPPPPPRGDKPWQLALQGSGALRLAVQGDGTRRSDLQLKQVGLLSVLMNNSWVAQILADTPDLLTRPHEYRYLLNSDRLRAALLSQEHLRDPALLPAAIRSASFSLYNSRSPSHIVREAGTNEKFRVALLRSGALQAAIAEHGQTALEALAPNPLLLETLVRDESIMAVPWRYANLYHRLQHEPLLTALTKDGNSILRLAIKTPRFRSLIASDRNPQGLTELLDRALVGRPGVVAPFVETPNQLLHREHWRALLSTPFFEYLGERPGFAEFLAGRPELLREIASRPLPDSVEGFGSIFDAPWRESRPAALIAGSGDGDLAVRARGAVEGLGERVVMADGVRVPAGQARYAAYWHAADGEAGRLLQEFTDSFKSVAAAAYVDARVRVRADVGLAAATRRSPGLSLALMKSPSLVKVLLEAPELLRLLDGADTDDTDAVIQTLYGWPEFFYVMRDHYPLYRLYVSDRDTRTDAVLNAAEFILSPDWLPLMNDPQLRDELQAAAGISLRSFVQDSPAATRLVRTHGLAALAHLHRSGFVEALRTSATAPWSGSYDSVTREPVVAAAASSLQLWGFLADRPGRVAVLAKIPELAEAFVRRRYELSKKEYRSVFDGELGKRLGRHPGQVANVFASPEMVAVAVAVPDVVVAMARVDGFGGLLGRSAAVRDLVRKWPQLIDAVLRDSAGLAEVLVPALRVPGLVGRLAADPGQIALIVERPSLLAAIRRNRSVMSVLTDPELAGVLSNTPALVAALSSKGLGRLRMRRGLVGVLSRVTAGLTEQSWRGVLRDGALLELLESQPGLAELFLTDPAVSGVYQQDPEHFVQTLAERARTGRARTERAEFAAATAGQVLTWLESERGGSRVSAAPPMGPVGASGAAGLGVSGSGEVAGAGRGLGAGVIRPGSWLADRINETEEVLDLLRGGGGPVVRALAEHPELLVLMLALPDIAGQLNAQPELVEGYLFRDFLVGEFWPEHGGSEDFVVALDTYLGERGIRAGAGVAAAGA